MVDQTVLDKFEIGLEIEEAADQDKERAESVAAYHACLITQYMSYLQAASYSTLLQEIRIFERGARQFLSKFPDPLDWCKLPVEEQIACDCKERSFAHYLFLRRLIPMPLPYILGPRPHLCQMAVRLMERETYQLYKQAARRLGYCDGGINGQFHSLVCLMTWAQKPMSSLTTGDLDCFTDALSKACFESECGRPRKVMRNGLPARWDTGLKGVRKVLYHMGIISRLARGIKRTSYETRWQQIPYDIAITARRYLQQLDQSLRPGSAYQEKIRLFRFFSWLAGNQPEITRLDQIRRCHIEAFKEYLRWAPLQHKSNRRPGDVLCPSSRYHILAAIFYFFNRIGEWQWPEAPKRILMFIQDLPQIDQPSPRFLEEVSAAKFLEAARNHPDLFTRLCGITLLFTGLREGEFLGLPADCIVQIGESHWLHVPVGKTHHDRFVPLNPEVKDLFDEWNRRMAPKKPFDFLFTIYGQRYGRKRVATAVERIAKAAGIKEKITPHQLRHTLATLAINRGMPLESIAALLGHRSLSMTMVYARIGNRTVQQEYSQVSQYLEEVCQRTEQIDGLDNLERPIPKEGTQMRKLRRDHWRMLGNGYCTRPEGVPCEYDTICESCPCFSTTIEFLPILTQQKEDAQNKGQDQRARIFNRLITSIEQTNENGRHPLPLSSQDNRERAPVSSK